MAIKIAGFDHMVLKCRDMDKALWFYGEVLGMEVLRLEEFRAGRCNFPSVRIDEYTILDLPPDLSKEPIVENVDHFCVILDPSTNMDGIQKELMDLGIAVEDKPTEYQWGAQGMGWQFKMRDPNGHRVELRCYPEKKQ